MKTFWTEVRAFSRNGGELTVSIISEEINKLADLLAIFMHPYARNMAPTEASNISAKNFTFVFSSISLFMLIDSIIFYSFCFEY